MSKVLLVTGADKGIGFYLVKEWLEQGNSACVLDLSTENLQELSRSFPERLAWVEGDVADFQAVSAAAALASQRFGCIDCAVHNACLCLFKSFEEHSQEDYERVMAVNFTGARNIVSAVLPAMKAQGQGKIFFTSSGVGVTGFVNISAYAASKGALESFAKCMNLEYAGSGISFHILHPPLTDTESASPLPVPREFKAKPEKVGLGLARKLHRHKFIFAPSLLDSFSVRMSYLFPVQMGRFLAKMTKRAEGGPKKK